MDIPASVRCIEADAFCHCQNLKRVTFAEGSRLEKIGVSCFSDSWIEEIQLPRTLKEIGIFVFGACYNLKTIYVEDGCEASLVDSDIPASTRVVSLCTTLTGGVSI